jgi:tetratricopeptide (TPR) repeat protein
MFEDKNLNNVYKLKKELEKDLERRGKKIPIEPEKKRTQTIYKPLYEERRISIPVENFKTWFDLVIFDVDLENKDLASFLESKLFGKSDSIYNNQIGLMHLLRKDFEKAEKYFRMNKNEISRFNLGILKVLRKERDCLDYAKNFTEIFPNSGYTYLLLSMIFLMLKQYKNSYVMLEKANNIFNYSFLHIITNMYNKNYEKAGEYISKALLEGKARKTVSVLNYFIGKFNNDFEKMKASIDNISNLDIPCAKCLIEFDKKHNYSKEPYCLFSKRLNKILSEEIPLDDEIDAKMISSFNKKESTDFDAYYEILKNRFGDISVLFFQADSVRNKGLKTFVFEPVKPEIKVSLDGPKYYDYINRTLDLLKIKNSKEYDFSFDIPFFEVLRYAFGFKTCEQFNQ